MSRALLAVLAHPDDESFGSGGTLARYAREGVDVHVAIATDGAAGTAATGYEAKQVELAAHRFQELEEACRILGVTLHRLGYRDSGMQGTLSNSHPAAFINADENEAVGKVVALIRQIRPQVVFTHDETGGYFHPDHIRCCHITTLAFHAAADPTCFVERGLAPYRSQRLFYTAFPRRRVYFYATLLYLRGKNPRRIGRNQDIDLTKLGIPPERIHATIGFRRYWEIKQAAGAAHGSQGGGRGGYAALVPEFLRKYLLGAEHYIRAYPPVPDGFHEKDLFAGLNGR